MQLICQVDNVSLYAGQAFAEYFLCGLYLGLLLHDGCLHRLLALIVDQQGGDDGNQQRGWQPDREKVQKQGFAVLRTWRHGCCSFSFHSYAAV